MTSRLEHRLLRHGTFNGPVDPAMIAFAQRQYAMALKRTKHERRKDGREDWIPFARKNFLAECPVGCVKPFNEEVM